MTNLTKIFSRTRSRLFYSRPLYIPGYEYHPWKSWLILAVVLSAVSLAIAGYILQSDTTQNVDRATTKPSTSNTQPSVAPSPTPTQPDIAEQPTTQPEATDQTPENLEYYPVSRVVDGDTIDVSMSGLTRRVRLIGVDTPESVNPRTSIECFGIESSNYLKSLLTGKTVGLESDSSQDNIDRYDRLLRYVFLSDGTNVNQEIIANGYGHEYTYNLPYKYQSQFKQAEEAARLNSKGLWASNTCSGN